MKKILLTLILCISTISLLSQNNVTDLVQLGIYSHDNGDYEKAIEYYEKALELDKKSPLVHYELSLTYMYMGKYNEAMKYSDLALKNKPDESIELGAYTIKGACLDYLGKKKESITLYKKAIKKFGSVGLLHFNLGCSYVNNNQYNEAIAEFIKSIEINSSHPGSHMQLGLTELKYNRPTQGTLPLYFFLLLEPTSNRSVEVCSTLKNRIIPKVEQTGEKSFSIKLNPLTDTNSEFASSDMKFMMFSLSGAANMSDTNKEKKSEGQLFLENTTSLFTSLSESDNKTSKNALWWNLYIPLFQDLAKTDMMETFCYVVRQSVDKDAADWVLVNSDKVETLYNWIANYDFKE